MNRVLVVEDSSPCAKLLRISLERAGFNVRVVNNVPEALNELHREMPDAVVCDLLLGLLGNGYDVVSAVRAAGEKIICIAITALPSDQIENHALSAGFDVLLRKPFSPSKLAETLNSERIGLNKSTWFSSNSVP